MAKSISQLTTAEVEKQMSIAGDPKKITRMMQDILGIIGNTIDQSNPAEIINTELVLKKVLAEILVLKRMYCKRTGHVIK